VDLLVSDVAEAGCLDEHQKPKLDRFLLQKYCLYFKLQSFHCFLCAICKLVA
jgi:hypothetical protein